MTDVRKPIIAIPLASSDPRPNLFHLYVDSLTSVGCMTRLLLPEDDWPSQLRICQGLLIPGGSDIDPGYYREKQHCEIRIEDRLRTDFEISVMRVVLAEGKPVLGICYGMQFINVFLGGTLYQDIGCERRQSLDHRYGTHSLSVYANPHLAPGLYEVNSSHHQCVKSPGAGVRPFAFSEDGIIEAFYVEAYSFMLGIQWHPERIEGDLSKEIFSAFAKACCAMQ